MIYKMQIRPILTYASTIWANRNKSNHNKIQTIQNKTLRNILQAPRYTKNTLIHKDLNVEPIEDFIKEAGKKFYNRISESKYDIIKNLGNYDSDARDKYKKPKDFLHIDPLT